MILFYVLTYFFSNRQCLCHITQNPAFTLSCGFSMWVWIPHILVVVCYLSQASVGFVYEIMFILRGLGTMLWKMR